MADTTRWPIGRVLRWAGALLLTAGLGAFAVFAYPRLHHSGDLSVYREYLGNDARDELRDGAVRVTALGTTMMLVDDGQTQILIDPYLTSIRFMDAALDRDVSTDASEVEAALGARGRPG